LDYDDQLTTDAEVAVPSIKGKPILL